MRTKESSSEKKNVCIVLKNRIFKQKYISLLQAISLYKVVLKEFLKTLVLQIGVQNMF